VDVTELYMAKIALRVLDNVPKAHDHISYSFWRYRGKSGLGHFTPPPPPLAGIRVNIMRSHALTQYSTCGLTNDLYNLTIIPLS